MVALAAAFSIPAFGQELPITGSFETRLGKLELIDGYPTEATAKKLYDDIDFQRACQAYIWALPAVGFQGLHLAHLNTFGAKDGDIVLYKDLKDKAGMLTPNITTIYAMSFWNIDKQGPLVVEVPAGLTAGGVLDIWQRPLMDIGQTGPDKGQGGKYLVLGPNSEDIKAEGYFVKRSPTNQLWLATRGLSPDPKAAEETLRKHKLYAWSQRENPGETKFVTIAVARSGLPHSQSVLIIGIIFPMCSSLSRLRRVTASSSPCWLRLASSRASRLRLTTGRRKSSLRQCLSARSWRGPSPTKNACPARRCGPASTGNVPT